MPSTSAASQPPDLRTAARVVAVDAPVSSGGQHLIAYFDDCVAQGALPRRSGIPNRRLLPVIPNIFMLEPTSPARDDWRFCIIGQELIEHYRFDPTGLCESDILSPEDLAYQSHWNRHVLDTGRPRITHGHLEGLERDFYDIEIVNLPILGPDGQSRWILGGLFFLNA